MTDIPRHHLHRSDGPSTSVDAAYAIDLTALEGVVFKLIDSSGKKGMTQDDVLQCLPHLPYSSVTARFSGLERKGMIHRPGFKRKGRSGRNQLVMFSREPAANPTTTEEGLFDG